MDEHERPGASGHRTRGYCGLLRSTIGSENATLVSPLVTPLACFLTLPWLAPRRPCTKSPSLPHQAKQFRLSLGQRPKPGSFVTSLPFRTGTTRGCALCPTDSRSCDEMRHSKNSWETDTDAFSRETPTNVFRQRRTSEEILE